MQLTLLSTAILALAANSNAMLHRHHARHMHSRDSYKDDALNAHNFIRSMYDANPLIWDDDLANSAYQAASTCDFVHQTDYNGGDYGQNLMEGSTSISNDVFAWAAEGKNYEWFGQEVDDDNYKTFGHFTQVVWKSTTKVGCYTYQCGNGLGGFTVCNYREAGNVGGQYARNV